MLRKISLSICMFLALESISYAEIGFVFAPTLSIRQDATNKSFSKQTATATSAAGTESDAVESTFDYSFNNTAAVTSINLGLGLSINGWLFAGLKILNESGSQTYSNQTNSIFSGYWPASESSDASTETEYTYSTATSGVGLQFGFLPKENFYFLVSYMVSLTRANEITMKDKEDSEDTGIKVDEETGGGLIVDFGWRFRLGAFGLGPQITYKSLTFAKETWTVTNPDTSKIKYEYDVATTQTSLEPYLGIWLQF